MINLHYRKAEKYDFKVGGTSMDGNVKVVKFIKER